MVAVVRGRGSGGAPGLCKSSLNLGINKKQKVSVIRPRQFVLCFSTRSATSHSSSSPRARGWITNVRPPEHCQQAAIQGQTDDSVFELNMANCFPLNDGDGDPERKMVWAEGANFTPHHVYGNLFTLLLHISRDILPPPPKSPNQLPPTRLLFFKLLAFTLLAYGERLLAERPLIKLGHCG